MAIRLIRCANSQPVTAYDDAVVFHSAKGHDYTQNTRGGVFEKVYNEMRQIVDNVNHKFIVQSGMALLYGIQFEIPLNETVEFSVLDLRNKYCIVYVEITRASATTTDEDDNEIQVDELTIECKLTYSANSYPTPGNTDLIANRYGTATMPLYKFQVDNSGQITGLQIVKYVYRAGVAEEARMMTENGVINGSKVSDLIYSDKDLVKNTDHAYYADRATSLGTTGTSVTRNKIDDDLYLPNRGAYLVTTQIWPLKTDNTTWAAGTTKEITGLPTTVKGNIFHVIVTGSDATIGARYCLKSALSGTSSTVDFGLVANGAQTSGSSYGATQTDIDVKNGKATIKPQGRAITGTLYLVVFIAGYK